MNNVEQLCFGYNKWLGNNALRESDPARKQSQMITGPALMQILQQYEALSLKDQVLGKVVESALRSHEDVFELAHMPYLALLLTHLRNEDSLSILGYDCCRHFHVVLQTYIIHDVGPEPRWPLNFRYPENTIATAKTASISNLHSEQRQKHLSLLNDRNSSKASREAKLFEGSRVPHYYYFWVASHPCDKEGLQRLLGKAHAMAGPA